MITKAEIPILLRNVNDLISSDKIAPRQIGELGEVAEPYVLDQSPDVLSIGRRCVQDGYRFNWEPDSLKPTLTCPSGRIVELVSSDCCPCLDDWETNGCSVAAPAVVKARPRGHRKVTFEDDGPHRPPREDQRTDVDTCESGDAINNANLSSANASQRRIATCESQNEQPSTLDKPSRHVLP